MNPAPSIRTFAACAKANTCISRSTESDNEFLHKQNTQGMRRSQRALAAKGWGREGRSSGGAYLDAFLWSSRGSGGSHGKWCRQNRWLGSEGLVWMGKEFGEEGGLLWGEEGRGETLDEAEIGRMTEQRPTGAEAADGDGDEEAAATAAGKQGDAAAPHAEEQVPPTPNMTAPRVKGQDRTDSADIPHMRLSNASPTDTHANKHDCVSPRVGKNYHGISTLTCRADSGATTACYF
jgi:hypothetical protein